MHTTSAMCFKGFSQRDVLSSRWKTMKNEGFVATLLIHLAPLITKCALNDIISCDVADALIISVVVTLRGVLSLLDTPQLTNLHFPRLEFRLLEKKGVGSGNDEPLISEDCKVSYIAHKENL